MRNEYQDLSLKVQKWIFEQGWTDLRDIQKQAIQPILSGNQDVLISAPTAVGKTEAFFLPACTAIADNDDGFGILYISPLKALINDQCRRLESLCDLLDIPVTPWHGDSKQSKKKQAEKNPSGILLITPESLESLLIRKSGWVRKAFASLQYIAIDEFHAFIGSERGYHLLSLLNRIEHLSGRHDNPIPRVALSATLGNIDQVPASLRPNQSLPCTTITTMKFQTTLKVQVRGYIQMLTSEPTDLEEFAEEQICNDLYEICRGDSHLIFANSRQRTENIAAILSDLCEQSFVPNEFFPHHGSLAKDIRQSLESRLQKETLPTTAVCTTTLELGIDIGKVNSIAQVTAPHSVSSLRQRLGRSGRRNNPAILRMFITENELKADSHIVDKLRMELVQSIAMVRLLIEKNWFEPEDTEQAHLSTLLHQTLAITAQWGGVRADQLYQMLCQTGPFKKISVQHFKQLLSHMGKTQLLTQFSNGELVLGFNGERLVNQYTFYAVFKTPEEFRLLAGSKTLGTLPLDSPVAPEQHIVFGGRRWKILEVDLEKKTIHVKATKGGRAPHFCGEGISIHDVVRKEMLKIYSDGDHRIMVDNVKVDFIDSRARDLLAEAVRSFKDNNLQTESIIQQGKSACLLPWAGDKIVNTLQFLLIREGFSASSFAGVVEIENASVDEVSRCLKRMCNKSLPSSSDLAELVPDKYVEKYDEFLPDILLAYGYGRRAFDIRGTENWLTCSFVNQADTVKRRN